MNLLIGIPLMLACFAVLNLVYGSVAALFLRLGLSLLDEPRVNFRRALMVGTASLWAQGLLAILANLLAVQAVYILGLPLAAAVYQKMLGMRYGRALVLALTQVLVLAAGVAVAMILIKTFYYQA
jgi:hypothetical protein